MKHLLAIAVPLALLVAVGSLSADEGNGQGNAYLAHTPAVIGRTVLIDLGAPGLGGALAVLGISDGIGPVAHPTLGTLCLDIFSPNFTYLFYNLPASGESTLPVAVPNNPSLVGFPPVFLGAVVVDGSLVPPYSITKSVRIEFEAPDAFRPTGALGAMRAFHQAVSLASGPRDNRTRVLIAGGGDGDLLAPVTLATTEIYSPLTRTFTAGPGMAVQRGLFRAVRLQSGQVLVCGGTDAAGNVTTSCELYDPATNAFVPTGSLSSPRTGHAATLLPDGRVLVSGGLTTYQNAIANLAAVMSTAQDTAEIYDPATGTWSTATGLMGSFRTGHTQTLLANGTVLVASGISGGTSVFGNQFPVYTPSCDVFDPATGMFTAAPPLPTGRAFHAASRLGNGDVLISGGFFAGGMLGVLAASDDCRRYDGAAWNAAGLLPVATSLHAQVPAGNGDALIQGGLTGEIGSLVPIAQAGRHDGTAFTPGGAVGTNPALAGSMPAPRGGQTLTRLYDGSYLTTGGTDALLANPAAYVYTE